MANSPLQPTFQGTLDAAIVFEACLSGQLSHVARRPHDRERTDLIRSGNVFIYEEHASGIKRWTDSVPWSPSRILGNFLIYRELDRPFPAGEKKRALKKTKKQGGITKSHDQRSPSFSNPPANTNLPDEGDRSLVGSLVDSYDFKAGGLVKKTISITYQGIPHHLVSYYSLEDVKSNRLVRPTEHPHLRVIVPRQEILTGQNYRSPICEEMSQEGYVYPGPAHIGARDVISRDMIPRDMIPRDMAMIGHHYVPAQVPGPVPPTPMSYHQYPVSSSYGGYQQGVVPWPQQQQQQAPPGTWGGYYHIQQ
ncbi:Global transcription regulator sge1 [Fusarium chlamydosporum]